MAFSRQQAARGKVVYSGGTYSPNRGQVSAQGAQGYMQREMRNQAKKQNNAGVFGGASRYGNDGQSDTRSGVAQRAGQRRQAQTGKFPQGQSGRPVQGETGDFPNNQGTPTTPGQPAEPPKPQMPALNITPDGRLELPYEAGYGNSLYESMAEFNNELLGIHNERNNIDLAYAAGDAQALRAYGQQQTDTLNDNAARGTAFSSAYASGVARDASAYNTDKLNRDAQIAQGRGQLDLERDAIHESFRSQLSRAALAYAEQLEEQAGDLGYGTNDPANNPGNGQGKKKQGKTGKFPGGTRGRKNKATTGAFPVGNQTKAAQVALRAMRG